VTNVGKKSLMKLMVSPFAAVIIGTGVFLCGSVLSLRAIELSKRRRATELTSDISSLTPGRTTNQDILQLVNKYGGEKSTSTSSTCPKAEQAYVVEVRSIAQFVGPFGKAVLERAGIHVWGTVATLWIEQDILCESIFTAGFSRPPASQGADLHIQIAAFPSSESESAIGNLDIRTNFIRNTRNLHVDVSSLASPDEKMLAYSLDLHCVTRLRGCEDLRELAPAIFAKAEPKP
jgi:hypothetical protein